MYEMRTLVPITLNLEILQLGKYSNHWCDVTHNTGVTVETEDDQTHTFISVSALLQKGLESLVNHRDADTLGRLVIGLYSGLDGDLILQHAIYGEARY